MLSTFPINQSTLNEGKSLSGTSGGVGSQNFDLFQLTKYAFLTSDGLFLNFNNVELKTSQYGNQMLIHDMDSLPEIDISKYRNALKNGGTIYDRRYTEKTYNIELLLRCDNIDNLESEIRSIKSYLEQGGYLYKKEVDNTLKIHVELSDLSVGRLLLRGTQLSIKLITMDPFWASSTGTTVSNEGNTGSFNGSLTLLNTKVKGFAKHIVYIRTVTGTINQCRLNISGFIISVLGTISNGSIIVMDGENGEVTLNGSVVKYTGQFPELSVGVPYPMSVTFLGGGTVDLFDIYTTYKNNQL